ncbi:MAG: peroxidase-related enzyme [Phycisphaeraceae bacterium]|nr:peroxidase-related enzyme [Phycisphaeraceae bacterium]MCB9848321.1 peroxidase-related enzyme [Phycisphaeraceae bacterium]
MAYIATIDPRDAEGDLRDLYDRVGNPDGTIDEVMRVHSLNPESLRTHFELYVSACHKPSPLSRIEREIVAVVVSRWNQCRYCAEHHAAGLERLLHGERPRLAQELRDRGVSKDLTPRELAMVHYATALTQHPSHISAFQINALRAAGLGDREILDLAQVVAYFAYANRIVLGLGCELESFPPGQHPPESSGGEKP